MTVSPTAMQFTLRFAGMVVLALGTHSLPIAYKSELRAKVSDGRGRCSQLAEPVAEKQSEMWLEAGPEQKRSSTDEQLR